MNETSPFVGDGALRARLARGVQTRTFKGELILLDSVGGDYFALNEVGRTLLELLERGKTLAESARELGGVYDVDWDVLCGDVTALYTELLSRRLIEPRTQGPAALEASS